MKLIFKTCILFLILLISLRAGIVYPQQTDRAESGSRAKVHYNNGMTYYFQADYKSAIKEFLKAVDLEPENKQYLTAIGDAYIRLGEFDKAVEYFIESSNLDPQWAWPVFQVGICYMQMGAINLARTYFQKAKDLGFDSADEYLARLEENSKMNLADDTSEKGHEAEGKHVESTTIADEDTARNHNIEPATDSATSPEQTEKERKKNSEIKDTLRPLKNLGFRGFLG